MVTLLLRRNFLSALFVSCIFYSFSEQSDALTKPDSSEFEGTQALDNIELDKMRGGFVSPEGIKFDLGISTSVYVDKVHQIENSFTANNIHYTGNSISASNLQNINSYVQTIIQNNLDNKTIQISTNIDLIIKNFSSSLPALRSNQEIRAIQNIQVLR